MGTLLGAIGRGVAIGYVVWFVVTNLAREIGRTFGFRGLLRGRARTWLNKKRRVAHQQLATGVLLLALAASVRQSIGDRASFSPLPFVGLAGALLVVELLLGGGRRKPAWNPWRDLRSKPGSSVMSLVSSLFLIPGLDQVGPLLDPTGRRGGSRGSSKRTRPSSAARTNRKPVARSAARVAPTRQSSPTRPARPPGWKPPPAMLADAAVAWMGYGMLPAPWRDATRVVEAVGRENAARLLPMLEALLTDFYRSTAHQRTADLSAIGQQAAAEFRVRHPEIDERAVAAFVWSYTYDHR